MIPTQKILQQYFNNETITIPDELESKKELKKEFETLFSASLIDGISPLLAFQVLYHRLSEIANVAKDVFYEPAIEELKTRLEDSGTTNAFGTKTTLKASIAYEYIPSPKMTKLQREREELEKKNEKLIKKFEKFKTDVKSIDAQIKAEQDRLVELKMAKETDRKESISLSY